MSAPRALIVAGSHDGSSTDGPPSSSSHESLRKNRVGSRDEGADEAQEQWIVTYVDIVRDIVEREKARQPREIPAA